MLFFFVIIIHNHILRTRTGSVASSTTGEEIFYLYWVMVKCTSVLMYFIIDRLYRKVACPWGRSPRLLQGHNLVVCEVPLLFFLSFLKVVSIDISTVKGRLRPLPYPTVDFGIYFYAFQSLRSCRLLVNMVHSQYNTWMVIMGRFRLESYGLDLFYFNYFSLYI